MADDETTAAPASPAEPVPLAVPLEEQISGLPSLQYPGADNVEFQAWAQQRRSRRLRVEVIGGAFLLVGGIVAWLVTQRPAFLAIAVFAVAALGAYELLVDSFE